MPLRVELVLRRPARSRRLTLRMSAKILVKVRNSRASLVICSSRAGLVVPFIEPIDGVLQAGFGRQRRLGVVFLAGHDVIAGQRPVGDQLAVDIAGEIGLRHAVAVGRHAGRDALEAEIGDAHAGGRDRQHDGKAEHDLGAKSQGREFDRQRSRPTFSEFPPQPPVIHSEKQAIGKPRPRSGLKLGQNG